MSFQELKEVIGDNEQALSLLVGLEEAQTELVGKISHLEKDSKKAFSKRDEAIGTVNRVKEYFGVEALDEDTLKTVKGGSNDSEINNLREQLKQAVDSKTEIESEYGAFKNASILEQAINEAGIAGTVANPEMYKVVKSLLQENASVLESGEVVYVNPDGSTVYNGAKPLTLQDRAQQIALDDSYAGLFKPQGSGGSGSKKTSGSAGGAKPNFGGSKAERLEAIKKMTAN